MNPFGKMYFVFLIEALLLNKLHIGMARVDRFSFHDNDMENMT